MLRKQTRRNTVASGKQRIHEHSLTGDYKVDFMLIDPPLQGPCQFLFQDEPLNGDQSYIRLISDNQVLVVFGAAYCDASLFKCLATVDPGRVKPHANNLQPRFHEVCVTFTDHEGRLHHKNVDICYLKPAPPNAKGQSLLLLCNPNSWSPSGRYGPYTALKVQRSSKMVTVLNEVTKKPVQYSFNQCVRILKDGENK